MEQDVISMEVINPKAAGIDVGSRSHWAAVGQSEQDKKSTGSSMRTFLHWLTGSISAGSRPLPWRAQGPIGKISMPFCWLGVFRLYFAMASSPSKEKKQT